MSTRRRSHTRVALAIVAVIELCLVAASPLWHHNHHDPDAIGISADRTPLDAHVCNTGNHATEGTGTCPVCLSQRLLTHGLTGQTAVPPAPAASLSARLIHDSTAGSARPEPILPRGPPAA